MFSIHFKCKYWIKCETNAFRHWTTRSSVFCGESRVVGGVDIIQGSAKLAFWDRRGIMVTIIRSWFQMHQIFQIVQPRKSFEAWEVFGGNRRKVSVQERKKNLVVQRKKYGWFFFYSFLREHHESGFGSCPVVGLSFDPYSRGRVRQLTASSTVGRSQQLNPRKCPQAHKCRVLGRKASGSAST